MRGKEEMNMLCYAHTLPWAIPQSLWDSFINTSLPVSGRLRKEDHQFEATLSYIMSSRPAWVTQWDHVSKKPTNQTNKQTTKKEVSVSPTQ
jgi:hypothetical protein